jgi:hypothetical protein
MPENAEAISVVELAAENTAIQIDHEVRFVSRS